MGKEITIYGKHSCISALHNKNRKCFKLFIEKAHEQKYINLIKQFESKITISIVNKISEKTKIPSNAVHQGIALHASAFTNQDLNSIIEKEKSLIVIIDQIKDPHNIGAIIRTSAAFNVDAIILTARHCATPETSPIISKIASGGLDIVPIITVPNIKNTMKILQKNNYWCYGIENLGENESYNVNFHHKSAIVLGSEDKGTRETTKKNCDIIIKIPISNKINSLNVANAASIILYEFRRKN